MAGLEDMIRAHVDAWTAVTARMVSDLARASVAVARDRRHGGVE